jgi:hypothetical protein
MSPLKTAFNSHFFPHPKRGCWIWTGARTDKGYGSFWINKKAAGAHRISWEFAFGKIPNNLNVLHRCDVRSCVNPEHLFLGTNYENSMDMVSKGRQTKGKNGELNPHSKLTSSQVIQIRTDNSSHADAARKYSVSAVNIGSIRRRKLWKHIP